MHIPTTDLPFVLADVQFEMLERICTEIAAEPWFVQDADREREFAVKVVFYFSRGLVIEDKLRKVALIMARQKFSRWLLANELEDAARRV